MPELPEVETIKNDLAKKLCGKTIKKIWTDHQKMLGWVKVGEIKKSVKPLKAKVLEDKIKKTKIVKLGRRAKNLLVELSSEETLWIHLKMTGHLLFKPKKSTKAQPKAFEEDSYNGYIHFIFYFTDGSQLDFSDLRKFARIRLIPGKINKIMKEPEKYGLGKLGPEPLTAEFSLTKLKELLAGKRKPIKLVLMEQPVIAGIGNIYASEILFDAGISPLRLAGELKPAELKKLHQSIIRILKLAVKLRGTSVSDFRDTAGLKGQFGQALQVYKRDGKTCNRCNQSIKRIKQGQRSTFYCPGCQK